MQQSPDLLLKLQKTSLQGLTIFLTLVLSFSTLFCGSGKAIAVPIDPTICPTDAPPSPLERELRLQLGDEGYEKTFLTYQGCAEEKGAWYMLPMPEDKSERMQAVHAIMLPSNKVLMASGSSNRNTLTPEGKFVEGVNTKDYDTVNNTSIFDPSLSDPYYTDGDAEPDFAAVPFTKIASPITPVPDPKTGNSESNDIFCSGHLQLPDGNVMFAGGTRRYYPGDQFQGSKTTNIFDWQQEEWIGEPHLMESGHWYPTLVPLHNGAIAVFSGLEAESSVKITPLVEIYDPNQVGTTNEWQAIDISRLPNSPFATRMNDRTFSPDYLDLYPRMLPVKTSSEDKFLITGDGGGKLPLPVHTSFNSYFVIFHQDESGKYSISFEAGPKRKASSKVYGTASLDPSSPNGDVLLYGGMLGTNDLNFGPGNYPLSGAPIASSVERWESPDNADCTSVTAPNPNCKGNWKLYPRLLSRIDDDIVQTTKPGSYPPEYAYYRTDANLGSYGTRAMQEATILPTKQVLMVNGGNYAEHWPVYMPTMFTPDPSKPAGFSAKLMNPDIEPRLYHNTSLLLPDARVLVMGGNATTAARQEDGTVRTDIRNNFEVVEPGIDYISAEIYRHAIFYPPYLFASGPRPEIQSLAPVGTGDSDLTELRFGEQLAIEVADVPNLTAEETGSFVLIKLASVTHSFDSGQRLIDLPIEAFSQVSRDEGAANGLFRVQLPENSNFVPPAYYMVFYVNRDGVPSHAKIVHLS